MRKPLAKNDVIERLRKYQTSGGFIYAQDQIAGPPYFDICHEYVLENCIDMAPRIRGINRIERKRPYKVKRKTIALADRTPSGRDEERYVLAMFEWHRRTGHNHKLLGELIDYQVPIKNSPKDEGAGKVDFISVIDHFLYLHEIKAFKSRESILKAILEVQTYYQQIVHERLIGDFGLTGIKGIKKSVVIFNGSELHKQIDNPKVQELLKLFEIELFILDAEEFV